jgi:hypothetical protein
MVTWLSRFGYLSCIITKDVAEAKLERWLASYFGKQLLLGAGHIYKQHFRSRI